MREDELIDALVSMADTLVDHYDIIDFLHALAERCVNLVGVSAAGIMLADPRGELRHAACSNEQMRLVELFELQVEEGPCFDAYRNNASVQCSSPEEAARRWPKFARPASESGFSAFSAVPMRLRADVIGALNLFSIEPEALADREIKVVQAMADIATIGILQERSIRDAHAFSSQLELALESRVVIEQAKGIVAEHLQVDVDESFQRIRTYARSRNRLLSETARQIVERSLSCEELTAGGQRRVKSGD
jgi:transcriptional regulator with GAF, ATPase, and Fis domain